MKMKSIVWEFVILCTFIRVNGIAVVTTSSQTFDVSVNGSVQLPCVVQNKGEEDMIIWEFIDHNVTISTGSDIRVKGGYLSKYEIYSQETSTSLQWNLTINKVQYEDHGTYRCVIKGMDERHNNKVVHHVQVEGAPSRPTPPTANVLPCCIEKSLDPCIYPLCDRGNADIADFIKVLTNDTCVDNNLIQVLECGQGGRNVLGCCIRSGVSDLCQTLCEGWGVADGTSYRSCVGTPALTVATCYDEGLAYLPGQPTAISAVSASTGFIASWQPPLQNADEVTKYRVKYRLKNTEHYDTVSTQDATELMLQVLNLSENRIYEFQVIAISGTGASRPSYSVDIAVRGAVPTENITQTIYDCCVSKDVSADCVGYCSADTLRRGGHPAATVPCFGDIDDMYKCLAYQGNHVGCCSRVNVPTNCLPLCEGKFNANYNNSLCFYHMPLIVACILEASDLLPSPPYNTRLVPGSVTSDSVTVAWENSPDFKDGNYYVVAWRLHRVNSLAGWNTVSEYVGNSFTITGLDPAEIYDVIVATENENGSSLPELTLIVVTEGVNYNYQPPYNETECCINKGVTGECLQLCSHTFRLTPESVALTLLTCNESVTPMIQCASDGRDHTECCIREGLPDDCLGLCSLHPEQVPLESFILCAIYKNELSTCFNEGKDILPLPPIGLTVKSIQTHSMTIDWQPPNGPNVTKYYTQYTMTRDVWTPMQSKESQESFVTIDGLTPNTEYYIRVFSINMEGTSLPSEVILSYTLPVLVDTNTTFDWDEVWQNRSDCCQNSGIADECKAGCVNGDVLDETKCVQDLPKIVACGSDGRDHVACCMRLPDFPTVCEPLCAGQVPDDNITAGLCISYSSSLYTCFTEGQGRLPSPPNQLRVQSYSHNQIIIEWNTPTSNCDNNCVYVVLIWTDENNVKRETVQNGMTYTFSGLKPQTEYRISALASNNNGTSLPSPYIIVRTEVNPTNGLMVNQNPGGIISVGDSVQLECTAYGRFTSLNWIRNKQSVINNNLYRIESVTKENEGVYFCNATFENGQKNSKQIFLNVKYKPRADVITEKSVLPGLNQVAQITCTFKGFPNTVSWYKEGTPLTNATKYLVEPFQPNLMTAKSTAVLRIRDVVLEDFGTYACSGGNEFGNDTITGELKNLTPTKPVPPTYENITLQEDHGKSDQHHGKIMEISWNFVEEECCARRNVSTLCATNICDLSADLLSIIYDTSLLSCLLYFEDYIACGTDGKDHSQCCKSNGVQDFCLGFCDGNLPQFDDSWELVPCLTNAQTIISCVQEGQNNIPTPPQNLQVAVLYDRISVTWGLPLQNAEKTNKYDIYYQVGQGQPKIESVSKSKTQYYLPEASKGVTYTVWGRSVNNYGQSAESAKQQITVNKLTPRSPTNIRAEVIAEVHISVQWSPPGQSYISITGYKIIYWQTNMGRSTSVSARVGNQYNTRLTDLRSNTLYSIVVVAQSADGYGEESEVKVVATGRALEVATQGPDGYSDDGQGKVGLALGLVFGVLFLVAVSVVVVMFYRKKFHGKPLSSRSDSVAFENPSFGNARRSGLPDENPDGNQFSYSNLKEENDHDQIHLSFDNPTINTSGDNPATLDVTA